MNRVGAILDVFSWMLFWPLKMLPTRTGSYPTRFLVPFYISQPTFKFLEDFFNHSYFFSYRFTEDVLSIAKFKQLLKERFMMP